MNDRLDRGAAADALIDLANALGRRVATAPGEEREARAASLRQHVVEYLVPRAMDLDAPLIAVILGSTGSGKSSLLNSLVGRAVSPSGVLRPTTRRPVAVTNPEDRHRRLDEVVESVGVDVRADPSAGRGVVLVDAPDFDSVEPENRVRALELLEIADLVVFVTTATRYADQVPWDVLARARQRGAPLLTVLNRLPPEEEEEADAVVADYRRLLEARGLIDQAAEGDLQVVRVVEGALDPDRDGLEERAIEPVRAAIDRLVSSVEARRELAWRGLTGALRGVPEATEAVAGQIEEEQRAVVELRDVAERSYRMARKALADELSRGTFLRAEVLRQWHDFVGAGQVARFLAEGIGKVTATVRALFEKGPPAPAAEVREAAFADLVALTVQHAETAAQRAAATWAEDRWGALALEAAPELWRASPTLGARLSSDLEEWADGIAERIRAMGARRKGWAQVASLGVNAIGTSAVLAVFVHTGGLTGTEVGITAATAVVNQKLLEAIFGEANVAAFVKRAREDLAALLDRAFDDERDRFGSALGSTGDARLAADLRDAARRVAGLVAA